ncbi:hypothetical protein GRI89_00845 [Altererythrobacter salegens]|uniref:Uncharacterized protein n=1 Tax=Croceibacterium salegens TaxID=1737568 RepID=A0A6I4SQF9_9SPHN|nr:hypothetical protein [Croceibacterium salegens]MXO58093.1 hypothetical protein [Croceibacterium salegens]
MIARTTALAAAVALLCTPAHAAAQVVSKPVEEKNLVGGKQKLDPAKGYIYVHGPNRSMLMLIKTPDQEQVEAYEADWREELAKAKKRYPSKLANWKRDYDFAQRSNKKKLPEKPVEPTEENFSIGNIERRMVVVLGPQFVFSKSESDFSYLQEVEPGTYTIYGPVFYAPNGTAAGTCYCMGTVKFEVAAGQVTNLGDFPAMAWEELSDADRKANPSLADWQSKPVDYTLPASLTSFGGAPADLHAAGKINNFFGVLVGRMPPVPGVLGYNRDVVVNLKAEQGAAE